MTNIEFTKEIKKMSQYYKEKTGENLNFSINEETGRISSAVYNGISYPRDREKLIRFMYEKIKKSILEI